MATSSAAAKKPKEPAGNGKLKVERVLLSELHEDPGNVRRHPDRNLAAIAASLARFGQQKPIVVDAKNVVRAGNGTLAAARRLGWERIDVVRTDLLGAEAVAYAIADNKTTDTSEWDEDGLAAVLQGLDEELIRATGFERGEIDGLLRALEPAVSLEDDVAPEPPENPVSVIGDLWELGGHRVLCGDSTKAEDVKRVLGGASPRLMVTDPPYGVEYDPDWRNQAGVAKTKRTGKVENDDRVDWTPAWRLFPGDVAYVWHAGWSCGEVAVNLHRAELLIRSQIIWAKGRFALSRGNYHWQHEPCWYAVRKGSKSHWIGDRTQSTVWNIGRSDGEEATVHGTQKPLECMARPMRNHDAPAVYDPFLGSGTTVMAADALGRSCFGLELSPAYVDVIVTRWQNRTSGLALCGGKNMDQLRLERLG